MIPHTVRRCLFSLIRLHWDRRQEVESELGRDHGTIALGFPLLEEVSDDFFRVPRCVEVGGIDEVSALFQVVREDRFGVLDARSGPKVFSEGHGPQTEWTNAKTGPAKCDV